MLRSWLEKPLLDPVEITRRHGAVEELTDNVIVRGELEEALRDVTDLERVHDPHRHRHRQLPGFAGTCPWLPGAARRQRRSCKNAILPCCKQLEAAIDPLTDCADRIENTHGGRSSPDHPGGRHHPQGRQRGSRPVCGTLWRAAAAPLPPSKRREREKTGIRTLKVGYQPCVRLLY